MWLPLTLWLAGLLATPLQTADAFARTEVALRARDSVQAEQLLNERLETDPLQLETQLSYQKLLIHLGREEELRESYALRLAGEPEQALWSLLAGALQPNAEEREDLFKRGIERLASTPAKLSQDPTSNMQLELELRMNLGLSLHHQGLHREALEALELAARFDPSADGPQVGIIKAMARLGRAPEAAQRFEALASGQPDSSRSRLWLGRAYLAAGEQSQARQQLEAFSHAQPDDLSGIVQLAALEVLGGNIEQAKQLSDRALQLDPYDKDGLLLCALVRGLLLHEAKGTQAAQLAVRLEPCSPKVHLILGHLQFTAGDLAGARASYNRALRWDPSDKDAYEGLANLALKVSDVPLAIVHLESSLRMNSQNTEIMVNLGQLHSRLGDRESARRMLERVEAIGGEAQRDERIRLRQDPSGELVSEGLSFDESWLRLQSIWADLHGGRSAKALAQLERLLEQGEAGIPERWAYCLLLERLGDTQRALTEYQRLAAELDGSGQEARGAAALGQAPLGICSALRAADCQWELGQTAQASLAYRRIHERFGDEVPAHEHLPDLVAALDRQATDAKWVRIPNLRVEVSTDASVSTARAICAVLKNLGLPAQAAALAAQFKQSLPAAQSNYDVHAWRAILSSLDAREDVDVRLFDGRWETLREQLDAGRALLQVLTRSNAAGEKELCLRTLSGYDERLGIVISSCPELLDEMTRVPTGDVDRVLTILFTLQGALNAEQIADLPGRELHELLNKATLAERGGDLQGSRRWLQSALELDPEHAAVLQRLALLDLNQGRFDEALALLERAHQNPANPNSLAGLYAQVLASQGRFVEAEGILRGILHKEPSLDRAHRELQQVLMAMPNRQEDALAAAEAFVAARPRFGPAYEARGYQRMQAGRGEESLEDFSVATTLNPTTQNRVNLGNVLGRLQRWEESILVLEAAISNESDPAQRAHAEGLLQYVRGRQSEQANPQPSKED